MSINIGNSEVINIYIGGSAATAVYIGDTKIWGAGGKDYSKEYFTLSALESGDFYWNVSNVEYSLNDGNWTTWTATDSANTFSVSADDKVRFRATANKDYHKMTINATGNFDVEGNSMSLFYGDNFQNQTTLPKASSSNKGHFFQLFGANTHIINAENLVLPATSLYRSYWDMFNGCSNLVSAPSLSAAITIDNYGVGSMFAYCTSLTKAPEFNPNSTAGYYSHAYMYVGCTSLVTPPSVLPATTLGVSSYEQMFQNCTSLTKAPVLPAATLTSYSYAQMFRGCTNLNYIKCLATDISASASRSSWVTGVAATGTFVKNANMNDWPTGASGIPNGWTVVDA